MSNTKFSIFNFQFSISEKGAAIYLSIAITVIILALALGIGTILLGQIKMIRGIGDSVGAFFAAETGIEKAMYKIYVESASLPFSFSEALGEASYNVQALASGSSECPSPPNEYYCIKSFGKYKETKRAIEVNQ